MVILPANFFSGAGRTVRRLVYLLFPTLFKMEYIDLIVARASVHKASRFGSVLPAFFQRQRRRTSANWSTGHMNRVMAHREVLGGRTPLPASEDAPTELAGSQEMAKEPA